MQPPIIADNPFAVLSFLAAPAILTNASTLLALGTSNRLARAADRARMASTAITSSKSQEASETAAHRRDFNAATTRAKMLVQALSRFYLSAGCFAAGTCVALLGAFSEYFGIKWAVTPCEVLTVLAAMVGVGALVLGALRLVRETRLALQVLDEQHAAITQWMATHPPSEPPGA